MPDGVKDVVIGLLAVARGVIVNAFVFLSLILLFAALTIAINPDRASLRQPVAAKEAWFRDTVFAWTITSGLVLAFLVVAMLIVLPWGLRLWNGQWSRPSFTWRVLPAM